jgi:hypothetical protein
MMFVKLIHYMIIAVGLLLMTGSAELMMKQQPRAIIAIIMIGIIAGAQLAAL